MEHISFRGRTGDTSQLVNFLVQTMSFKRVDAPMANRFIKSQIAAACKANCARGRRPCLDHLAARQHRRRTGAGAARLQAAAAAAPVVVWISRRQRPPQRRQVDAADPPTSSASSYLDNVRYATPQEEGQVLWKRWPN